MTLWSIVKLILPLEEPIRLAIVDIVQAIKSGDAEASRKATERAMRTAFEVQQAVKRKGK